jgi:RecJ-like exonuclease
MACGYQGYEFGAGSYPDSICIDGRLFDADNCDDSGNLYQSMEDVPCPICRRAEAVKYWTERNRCGGTTAKRAAQAARSLVRDIRQRRGLRQ